MAREIGVQSVVFGHRDYPELLEDLTETSVRTLELWDAQCPPDGDSAGAREAAEAAGVDIVGYGVLEVESPGEIGPAFAFADALGAEYVTVNFDPADGELADALVAAAGTHDLDVAVHNYSTVHHDVEDVFSSIAEVVEFLDSRPHPRLGACVDTGHFLVMDENPAEAVRALGDRIATVHLKDTSEAAAEDVPGRGELALERVLALLDEHAGDAPLIVEYELDPDEAVPGLEEAAARLRTLQE
jgi:sugar phosphate isomerase/epimerase